MINADSNLALNELGYLLSQRRSHHSVRVALLADSPRKLVQELELAISKADKLGSNPSADNRLAFVFSGQGPQWWAMGRQLMHEEPVFGDMIRRCDALMQPVSGWSLWDKLNAAESDSELHLTSIAQPSIFAIQVALAELLQSWGIHPDFTIGHSVGEVAAAYTSGILDLPTACKVIVCRGRCMDNASTRGGMLAVGMPAERAQREICDRWTEIGIAAVNAPGSVTLSGPRETLEEIDRTLGDDVFHKLLRVEYAFHSSQMDGIKADLMADLGTIRAKAVPGKMVGTVTGDWVAGPELAADYWWQNVRQGVQFASGIQSLIEAGCTTFVEISAHPALTASIRECLADVDHHGEVIPTLRRHEDERREMLTCLSELYRHGYSIDWQQLHSNCATEIVLPTYPWQHQSLWHECPDNQQARLGFKVHPYLGRPVKAAEPTWQTEINRQAHGSLWDHVVQGSPIFPAAAYLEIGFAVAREVYQLESFVLEDVEFRRALFLPESADNRLFVQTVFSPDTSEFRVYAKTDRDDEWSLCAVGKIRNEGPIGRDQPWSETRPRISEVTLEEFYGFCIEKRIEYGPAFQGVAECWITDGGSLGRLAAPPSIADELESYLVHPSLLDAGLQVTFQSATEGGFRRPDVTVPLPVRMNRVVFLRPLGDGCFCDTEQTFESHEVSQGNLIFVDSSGNRCLEIDGLMVQSIDDFSDARGVSIDDLTYATEWHLKPLPAQLRRQVEPYLPPTEELESRLDAGVKHLSAFGWSKRAGIVFPAVEQAINAYTWKALLELGWRPDDGQPFTTEQLIRDLGIVPSQQRQLDRLLQFLACDGLLAQDAEGRWTVNQTIEDPDPSSAWNEALSEFPSFSAELALIARCGEQLAKILTGEIESLEVIFPAGSMDTADHLYHDSPSFKFGNQAVAQTVALAVDQLAEGRVLRILEIGAGTGATTSAVLPQLPPEQYEYTFTDVSAAFFSRAKQKFQRYPGFDCGTLDIEQDPAGQGFEPQVYDLVLATDVLHATADLKSTLAHVKSLLSPSGLLIINELNAPARWFDFVFGLLNGWWRFNDHDLRPDHATLNRSQWLDLMQQAGFAPPHAVTDLSSESESGHVVYVCRNQPTQATQNQPETAESTRPTASLTGNWLVFADERGVGTHLAAEIQRSNGTAILVKPGVDFSKTDDGFLINPANKQDFNELLMALATADVNLRGVVFSWPVDGPALDSDVESLRAAESQGCFPLLKLVQSLAQQLPGVPLPLWVITRGAQPVGNQIERLNMAQTMVVGVGRVSELEQSNLTLKLIDLSPAVTKQELENLVDEFHAVDEMQEQEVALRGRARYVPRVIRKSIHVVDDADLKLATPETCPYKLGIGVAGMFDSLALAEFPFRNPQPDEVLVRIKAAGLNFRDVMKAMGVYPTEAEVDDWLGDECVGEIVAVGNQVKNWSVGDQVAAITPACLASHAYVPASRLLPRPSNLDDAEAATLPIAFLTAWYALHELGRIRGGQRVLIHSATGGVGLAAIQIARLFDAEIFATAGTPEKRAFLKSLGVDHVLDSRSLAFGDQILAITEGQGVDLVLNSLAGQAIAQGMNCLAPYGRFLEIGKRDIYGNSKLAMRVLRNNLSFFAIDLGKVVAERPEITAELWDQLLPLFESGKLRPLANRIFAITDAEAAFRFVGQARHIGKMVFTTDVPEVRVQPLVKSRLELQSTGSYLITGGLGGFGLAVAGWLVDHGARHLVLTSRSGAPGEAAMQTLAALRQRGVTVEIATADVSCQSSMQQLFQRFDSDWPPLRGLIHAAMVLEDDVIVNLDEARFRNVSAPKSDGAWILSQLLVDQQVDFFVMFSSMVQLFGNMGQASYCAANSFLVSLAHQLRKQGIPALTIDWGRIADVGYVSRRQDLSDYFDKIGEMGVRSEQGTYIVEQLLLRDATHATAMNLYWPNFSKAFTNRAKGKFSTLVNVDQDSGKATTHANIRHVIGMADPENRPSLLTRYLTEELANVLGAQPDELDSDVSLNTLGLDSLMTVELKNRIEQEAGVNLPIMEIMRGPSLEEMSAMVLRQLEGDTTSNDGQPVADEAVVATPDDEQSVESLLDRIDEMSEEEIEAAMQQLEND